MATSFSVADLIADVAKTANVPDFTTDTNITSSQIAYKLAQSARSLSAKYRQKMGEDLDYLNQATLTVQAGVGLTSLPQDCGEVQAILWAKTSSDWRLLDAAAIDDYERGALDELKLWREQGTPHYQIQGNTIAFYPASSGAETVVVLYTKHLDVDADADTVYLARVDCDRWITLDLVIWVLNAQGRSDQAAVFQQEMLMLEQNLFANGRKRDTNAIHTIRDTRGRRAGHYRRDRWGYDV